MGFGVAQERVLNRLNQYLGLCTEASISEEILPLRQTGESAEV